MAVAKEMLTILSQLKSAKKYVKVFIHIHSRVIYSASYLLVYQLDNKLFFSHKLENGQFCDFFLLITDTHI